MNFRLEIVNGNITDLLYDGGNKYRVNSLDIYTSDILDEKKIANDRIEEICKRFHGIAICENREYIRIYNDPFCSHPVYIIKLPLDRIIVSSQFNEAYKYGRDLHVDYCGIYELLWTGQVLHDRTIFREIKQLPAASLCEISRNTKDYRINTFYDFDIYENKNISTQKKADDIVYQRLKEIFNKYKNKNVLMGLSGGLDSRLSACLLSECLSKNNLLTFTFGYNKHILEYSFAKKVTKKLNFMSPIFIKLNQDDYKRARELALKTGCHVGMAHGHTYECLKRMEISKDTIFVSNYYSDAVMGWDARKDKLFEKMDETELYKKICQNKDKLPKSDAESVVDEALSDLKKIVKRYNSNSNFSCFEEFFYVIERNTKFHLRSAYQCNDILMTETPFADFDLLETCISVPLKYRWEKKLEKNIIRKYYFNQKDISSRRYFERSRFGEKEYSISEKVYYNCGTGIFKGLNLLNIILAKISKNRFQVINPYQTENQRIVFDRYFKNEFLSILEQLKDLRIISIQTYEELKKNKFKSDDIGLKYSLIDLGKCIDKIKILDN